MEKKEILARLQELLRNILDSDNVVLTPDTRADDVKGWDSIAHLRLMVATEEAFAVRFDVKEINSMQTVGALVELVHRKVG